MRAREVTPVHTRWKMKLSLLFAAMAAMNAAPSCAQEEKCCSTDADCLDLQNPGQIVSARMRREHALVLAKKCSKLKEEAREQPHAAAAAACQQQPAAQRNTAAHPT